MLTRLAAAAPRGARELVRRAGIIVHEVIVQAPLRAPVSGWDCPDAGIVTAEPRLNLGPADRPTSAMSARGSAKWGASHPELIVDWSELPRLCAKCLQVLISDTQFSAIVKSCAFSNLRERKLAHPSVSVFVT